MSTHCQPLPRPLVEEMLQVVARAICDRPGDNAAQRESRTRQMVHSVLGFEPRDGLEYMLSTIAFGHFQLILDSMRDVFQGQTDTMKAKTKTTIVAMDRAMLEMVRELRVERRRPLARSVETERHEEAVPSPAAEPVPVVVVTPLPVAAAPVAPDPPAGSDAASASEARATEIAPEVVPEIVEPARSGPVAPAATAAALPLSRAKVHTTPTAFGSSGISPDHTGAQIPGSNEGIPAAAEIMDYLARTPVEAAEGTFEENIAAFEAAYAATMEILTEARVLEVAKTKAANGD